MKKYFIQVLTVGNEGSIFLADVDNLTMSHLRTLAFLVTRGELTTRAGC